MKIKAIDRIANIAWSPQPQYPIYLAAGTADQPFSTAAALEIYELNLSDPGHDMILKASAQCEHRFHKLKWGTCGQSPGVIVGGCNGGVIEIYNSSKFLKGENGLISEHSKHNGPVKALDFNSFQNNLFASGASESEIYIWDLNNPSTAMMPGSKSQPLEDITSVAWNKQVQHILASSFPTKCVVWDLRKNDPIIKLTDSAVKIRWSVAAWNPDIATQLCLGSEVDQNPVIQLWDLRFATSPLKILENHKQGILSISWCQQDTDMLLSCGRDNKIVCWNPNSSHPGAETICEIISSEQWNFDVSWCPRNPALLACSSFDGQVGIYSLVGGPQQVQTSNKIADSFPGMELYTQAPVPQAHSVPVELKKAPKWLKRPIKATFGFGGKLVTIENISILNNETPPSRRVYISQVVTEQELLSRSVNLEMALQNGQYAEFCQSKIAAINNVDDKNLWQFIAANFDSSPRHQFLNLLGFCEEELNEKLKNIINQNSNSNNEIQEINDRIAKIGKSDGDDSDLNNSSNFDVSLSSSNRTKNFKISVGDDVDGLIVQAILLGNIEAAVDLCMESNRMADAVILAITGGSELLAKTQFKYFQRNGSSLSTLISAVVTEDWFHVIRNCDIESWKEALAAAISHTNNKEFPELCEILGERLENEKNGLLSKNAQLCYICAGNLEKIVASWQKSVIKESSPNNLQELVELIMILKKAMELQGKEVQVSTRLADFMSKYAAVLASQGSLEAAISYLGTSNEPQIAELRERLNYSAGRTKMQNMPNQPTHFSNQLTTQRTGTLSSGYYHAQKKQDEIVSNPQVPQTGFNLNPIQLNQTSAHTYQPLPSSAPIPVPVSQSVPPPLSRAYPGQNSGSTSGMTSRTKHVLDPSVQSSIPRPLSTPHFYNQNQFQTLPYPQPVQPNNFNINPSGYPPDVFNPSTNSTHPQSATPKPATPVQAPGWNDPPILETSKNTLRTMDYHHPKEEYRNMSAEHAGTRKWKSVMSQTQSQQPKQEFVHQAPITHPLMGNNALDSAQELNGQSGDYYQHQAQPLQQQQQQQQQSQYQFQTLPGQQQYGLPLFQPVPVQNQNSLNFHTDNAPGKQLPPKPVKKAIPEEHVILQTVFDDLRSKCLAVANNPQSKKKLEDVSRKLDALYDNLREGTLSSNTLQGLHLLIQHVQAGNYTNGLMLHTQLVSGPDFSQIASFMPGIKVLLQSALQLEVYL